MSHKTAVAGFLVACAALAGGPAGASAPPVRCVLFTHIEDNTPGGTLGSAQSRQNYLLYRSRLIDMGNLAAAYGVPWTLQPDWKFLEAALLYEDAGLVATTNGKNVLRYLKEDLGAMIDAHSHENGGYNYTDVSHLIDSLGVGSTTVIGGHIWDPSLPQFSEWDRFRVPVAGEHYPAALWRGDILMGSGTPNHVNDPEISGVWRPRDRDHYFEHDPAANIAAIGQYKGTIEGLSELVELYRTGEVPELDMLTSSYGIRPATLIAPGGIASLEDSVVAPVAALRDSGLVLPTDFTTLVADWQALFGSRGFLYDPNAATGVGPGASPASGGVSLDPCFPNPFTTRTEMAFSLARPSRVRLAVFDAAGRRVALLLDEVKGPGRYTIPWDAGRLASGVYFGRIEVGDPGDGAGAQRAAATASDTRRLVLIR